MIGIGKHIVTVFLAAIVSFPILYSALLNVESLVNYWQIEKKLEAGSRQKIKVHKRDILWIKKEKEILIHNELFDISSIETKGDFLILQGYFDKKEKEILAGMAKNQEDKKHKAHSLLLIPLIITYTGMSEIKCFGCQSLLYPSATASAIKGYSRFSSPPPKCMS